MQFKRSQESPATRPQANKVNEWATSVRIRASSVSPCAYQKGCSDGQKGSYPCRAPGIITAKKKEKPIVKTTTTLTQLTISACIFPSIMIRTPALCPTLRTVIDLRQSSRRENA